MNLCVCVRTFSAETRCPMIMKLCMRNVPYFFFSFFFFRCSHYFWVGFERATVGVLAEGGVNSSNCLFKRNTQLSKVGKSRSPYRSFALRNYLSRNPKQLSRAVSCHHSSDVIKNLSAIVSNEFQFSASSLLSPPPTVAPLPLAPADIGPPSSSMKLNRKV